MIEKLQSHIILYSYIAEAVTLFLSIFVTAVSLIIASSNPEAPSLIYFYVAGGFCLASLIVYGILSALYFVGDDEERNTARRIKATLSWRIVYRCFSLVQYIVIICAMFINGTTSNAGWDNFLKVYSIMLASIFTIVLLYSLWKKAWIKENPERFSYAAGISSPHSLKKKEEEKQTVHPNYAKEEEKPAGKPINPVYSITDKEDEKPALTHTEVLQIPHKDKKKKKSKKD
jgi:hypothetical protein